MHRLFTLPLSVSSLTALHQVYRVTTQVIAALADTITAVITTVTTTATATIPAAQTIPAAEDHPSVPTTVTARTSAVQDPSVLWDQ